MYLCLYMHVYTSVLITDGLQLPSTIWPLIITSPFCKDRDTIATVSIVWCQLPLTKCSYYKVKAPQTTNHELQ